MSLLLAVRFVEKRLVLEKDAFSKAVVHCEVTMVTGKVE